MTQLPRQSSVGWEDAATRVSGCRVSPALLPVSGGSSDHTSGRCTQVKELLCLVTELGGDVSRLRCIRECKEETNYWNRTLPSLRQAGQTDRTRDVEDSLSSLRLVERSDLGNNFLPGAAGASPL